jgi:hypothetical protein
MTGYIYRASWGLRTPLDSLHLHVVSDQHKLAAHHLPSSSITFPFCQPNISSLSSCLCFLSSASIRFPISVASGSPSQHMRPCVGKGNPSCGATLPCRGCEPYPSMLINWTNGTLCTPDPMPPAVKLQHSALARLDSHCHPTLLLQSPPRSRELSRKHG